MRSTAAALSLLLAAAVLLAGLPIAGGSGSLAWGPPEAHAQESTPLPAWTLPPTWTPTPTRQPTDTPRPIPTRVPSATPTLTPSPYPTPDTPPRAARLSGMRLIWQQYNGCASAALTMMLLYHDWRGTRDGVTRGIKPNDRDPSVRGIEMVTFVEAQELRAVVRTGGTLDILRRLVAAGFPVLVENVYNNGREGWMGHNRVVMGYDDEAGQVLTFDSVLGAGRNNTGRPISYVDFDALWQPFNRAYMVVFPPEAAPRIEAILGPHWNATSNAQMTLFQAEAEIQGNPENAFALFNLGTALLTLGQAGDAVIAFERAQEIGLPWRYLWYQFGPFEAYLATGRFHDTIALGEQVLNTSHGVEEVYYYMGLAYAGLGDIANARRYYGDALARNSHFIEAEAALSRLPVGAAAGP